MAADTIAPTVRPLRSFIYREVAALGARFVEVAGAAVAADYGRGAEAELTDARRLGLADLSPLPRTGFKGRGAIEFLTQQGVTLPDASNRALRQADGALAARLSPGEMLLLGGLPGTDGLAARLEAAWATAGAPRGFPVPRRDTHAWFMVTGNAAPQVFAKICGVDLRLNKFADGEIAQTSVARLSAIVVRQDLGVVPAFHLLADSASAAYLWAAMLDAMAELDGRPVGRAALLGLAG